MESIKVFAVMVLDYADEVEKVTAGVSGVAVYVYAAEDDEEPPTLTP